MFFCMYSLTVQLNGFIKSLNSRGAKINSLNVVYKKIRLQKIFIRLMLQFGFVGSKDDHTH